MVVERGKKQIKETNLDNNLLDPLRGSGGASDDCPFAIAVVGGDVLVVICSFVVAAAVAAEEKG